MPITHTWKVETLERKDRLDDQGNVELEGEVKVVHWSLNSTDGTHSVRMIGTEALDPADPADFTAYKSLDKPTVLGWLDDDFKAAQEANAEAAIARKVAEAEANAAKGVPW